MNFQNIFTSSFFLKKVFLGALFILILISGITYRHTNTLSKSTDSVLHSYKVQLELEQLISYIKDAETGQRGYIITKDPAFLKPYNNSRHKVNQSYQVVKKLTTDNLKQQNNLDTLHKLIDLRYSVLVSSLRINSKTPINSQDLYKSLVKGKILMDIIRLKIDEMIKLETIYLDERQLRYNNEISFTPIFTLSLFLFTVLIFAVSYLMVTQDLINLKKANQVLSITTEAINQAEEIGNTSSWQWDLEKNIFTYSDNLFRLLACNPQSFSSTSQNFIDFVHPEDRHILLAGIDTVLKENRTTFHFFRVIRRDGELRYFTSTSKILSDANNRKIVIGVTSDVTKQHLDNLELEDRNRELEQSNKELASFNYVASHDLQEPLRKIQLFISRIEDTEKKTLSEVGNEYFSRINLSALRMRTLIDDLLMFSRTNKVDKAFERTDLTNIFKNVKNELTEIIEEKKATIEFMRLPTLQVIPYQIQQLFINLISNSLKYSKSGIAPFIKVECEKVRAKDYKIIMKADGEKKYFKFTFKDNGIGFEQSQAENIFVLFNRLHHKTEYSGTGIGLAICKKIVENHGGFITATSIPEVGSTFVFFLPE